jgi:long-chain fatty acid transport protein
MVRRAFLLARRRSARHGPDAARAPRTARRVATTAGPLLALGVVLARPAATFANPPDTFGFGARSTALAGAVSADVSDFSAVYYNPAGLAADTETRLELGYMLVLPELRMNGRDNEVDSIRGMVGGLRVPTTFFGQRFGFGLAMHVPDERISRTRSLPLTQPRWEMYDNRPHRLFIGVGVAWRPLEWLSVGAGISFQATSTTRLEVEGTIPAFGAERGSKLTHQLETRLLSVRYPLLGVQVTPTDWLAFGVTYRGEFRLGLELEARVDADITLGARSIPALFDLYTRSVNAFLPRQLSFGAALRPHPRVRASAEVTWVNWAAYELPVGYTDVALDLTVPPEFAAFVTQPGPILGSRPIPSGFRDRFVPRFGVEVLAVDTQHVDLRGRVGYFYEATPVPEQTGLGNFVDSDRHAVSLGLGATLEDLGEALPGRLLLDLAFQIGFIPERVMRKESLLDPTGSYRAGGIVWALGATTGVTFR